MTFYTFALRTDKAFDKVKQYVESISGTTGFAVREVSGDNEHWHWYLRTPRKIQSFRVNLTKSVPELRGNGGYSCADCRDVDKYLRYICKGDGPAVPPEVVWKAGLDWSDEKLDELNAAYWTENQAMKKRKLGSVQDYVIDEAKRTAIAWDDRRSLTRLYIKELVSRSKPINTFAVKASIRVIQCILCPTDDAIEEVVNAALV